jgi:hypothetical protein
LRTSAEEIGPRLGQVRSNGNDLPNLPVGGKAIVATARLATSHLDNELAACDARVRSTAEPGLGADGKAL